MPDEIATVTIDRPVREVFAFLANAENDRRWRPAVIEMTKIAGEGPGATYRQIVAGPGGRRIDADIEITEVIPNQRIAFRAIKGPVRPVGSYDLAASDGGTAVTFRLGARLSGFRKLMAPVVDRTMKAEVAALSGLKHVLEEESRPG